MDALDPDDPRPPFQQVVSILRASIATGQLSPGDRLPSYGELAKRFDVAPMTIQKAIGILRDESLVVTRQGKGSFVRHRTERTVGLRPHVEQAFEGEEALIDFAGFSAETLYGVIQEPLDKIRAGRLGTKTVHLRILLPDLTLPISLPSPVSADVDSALVRERMQRIAQRSTQAILDTVEELAALKLVDAASAEVRYFHTSPVFKMFLLNKSEVFFGFYPVVRHAVAIKGEPVEIFDPMGKDAELFQWTANEDPDAISTQYVSQAQLWFDSVWSSVARGQL